MTSVVSELMTNTNCSPSSQGDSTATRLSLPRYLFLRGGVYYFKRKLPTDVARASGMKAQTWKSLETRELGEAVEKLGDCIAEFDAIVVAARKSVHSGKRPPLAVQSEDTTKYLQEEHIPALLARYEYFLLSTDDDERREIGEVKDANLKQQRLDEWLALLEDGIAQFEELRKFDVYEEHKSVAAQLLKDERLIAPPGSEPAKLLLKELFEKDLELLHVQRNRLLEKDKKRIVQTPPSVPMAPRAMLTLRSLHKVWSTTQSNLRTVETYLAYVDLFEALHGALPVASIQHRHVEAYRDELAAGGRVRATVQNHLSGIATLVRYGVRTRRISVAENVFAGVPLNEVPESDSVLDRRAYEIDELRTLFSSRVYTEGYRPKGQSKEAAYWLPLIGLFAGPRLEEVAQLVLRDIQRINGAWVIRIADLDKNQRLKTSSSFRFVPVHQELIRCGLLAYAATLKAAGETRLFPSLRNDNKYQRFGTSFGSWFGRYLTSIGLADPRLDYHAFRFNFKQRCSQSGVRDEVRDALSGHWLHQNPASRGYMRAQNRQYPLTELVDGMNLLTYDELDLSHLYVADPLNGIDILR